MSGSQKFGMCERHGFDEPHALWLFVNGQNHVYEDSAKPAMINSLAIDLQFLTSCRYDHLDVVYSLQRGLYVNGGKTMHDRRLENTVNTSKN